MDRALYNDGFEVTQKQLQRTEDTRVFHMLERFKDTTQMGVASGLGVAPNAGDASLVDVSPGSGYEFIEIETPLVAQTLRPGSTLVVLFYTEIETDPSPHVSDGSTAATAARRAVRFASYSQTEFQSLPATSSDLSIDAQDRALIIALVPATVSGVGSLTTNDITLPDTLERVLTITQPVNTTGVAVVSIDPTTPITAELTPPGTGTLTYDAGGGVADPELSWTAPGDSGPGSTQLITDDGVFTLASANGRTIDVDVLRMQLPSTNQTDNLTVYPFYDPSFQPVPVSASDLLHRDSRVMSVTNNPHGLRLEDLLDAQAGALGVSVPLVTGKGLLNTIANSTIPQLVQNYASATGPEQVKRTLLWESSRVSFPSTSKIGAIRIYRSPFTLSGFTNQLELVQNCFWDGANEVWTRDNTGQFASRIYLDGTIGIGSLHSSAPGPATWTDAEGGGGWDVDSHNFIWRGSLKLGDELNNTTQAAQEVPRLQINRSAVADASKTLVFKSDIQGAGPLAVRVYRSRFAGASNIYDSLYGAPTVGECLELVINARWDGSPLPGMWFRDAGITDSFKITISPRAVFAAWKDVLSADGWLDDLPDPLDVPPGAGWDFLGWEALPESRVLRAQNTCRAWGTVVTGVSASVSDGFGFDSTITYAGSAATVTFATGLEMANTDYSVLITNNTTTTGEILVPRVSSKGLGSFNIEVKFLPAGGGATSTLDLSSFGRVFGVAVFASQ
jgi:hypothetical protein